jgi:ribose transport system permease protein
MNSFRRIIPTIPYGCMNLHKPFRANTRKDTIYILYFLAGVFMNGIKENKNEKIQKKYFLHRDIFIYRIFLAREFGVFVALIIICIIMSFASPYFLKYKNIFNVLRSMSTIGIMAIGMTMVIITAGIDLSVGSLLGVCSMFTARLIFQGLPPFLCVFLGILFGIALGTINGVIITKVKVTPFVVTLGMLSMARGLTFLISTGLQGTVSSNIPMPDKTVNFLGAGYLFGVIPFPVVELAVLVVIFSLFLKYTVLGRQIYAVGSNFEAAKLSGVNVDNVRIFVYAITGGFCALAGIMTAGLLGTAATNYGTGEELNVIAAVVIGGTSLMGGEGSIIGAIIGAAIMAIIKNAFVLLKLPPFAQMVTIGAVIILAVATDRFRKRTNITE